jgi:hypothetical protein
MNWIVQVGKALMRAFTDAYRPERHYMRGPGPKWRAKHHGVTVTPIANLRAFDRKPNPERNDDGFRREALLTPQPLRVGPIAI